MHASDETTGHEPVEIATETRDTDLTDEDLDRARSLTCCTVHGAPDLR